MTDDDTTKSLEATNVAGEVYSMNIFLRVFWTSVETSIVYHYTLKPSTSQMLLNYCLKIDHITLCMS